MVLKTLKRLLGRLDKRFYGRIEVSVSALNAAYKATVIACTLTRAHPYINKQQAFVHIQRNTSVALARV